MITTEILQSSKLSPIEWNKLFSFYSCFFQDTHFPSFYKEGMECSHIIILYYRDKIAGFSFIGLKRFTMDKVISVVWNGPTILDKKIPETRRIFCRWLGAYCKSITSKLPVGEYLYFFLMSEGIDSYLFGLYNFRIFYPNPKQVTPPFETKLIHFLGNYFGGPDYNPTRQTVIYEPGEGILRENSYKGSYPKSISDFYQKKKAFNEYLCCLGVVDNDFYKLYENLPPSPLDQTIYAQTKQIMAKI